MLIIPVKAEQHKEEVEEAGYLASASDLMVGLLFVFIIMVVILSQRVEQAESGEKGDPLESAVMTIGKKMKAAGVPVVIDPASGVITLPADTLFPRGVADLNSGGIEVLTQAKIALNEILPCYIYSERLRRFSCFNPDDVEIETIFIEGHTDSAPLQRGIYTNWHLGLDRARAVYDVITVGTMQNFKMKEI